MRFATKFIQQYPPLLMYVTTLPWEIKKSIFCRYSADMNENANKFWYFRCLKYGWCGRLIAAEFNALHCWILVDWALTACQIYVKLTVRLMLEKRRWPNIRQIGLSSQLWQPVKVRWNGSLSTDSWWHLYSETCRHMSWCLQDYLLSCTTCETASSMTMLCHSVCQSKQTSILSTLIGRVLEEVHLTDRYDCLIS